MPELATKRSKSRWTTVTFGDVVRQVKDRVDPEVSGLERYVAGEHMDTDDLRIRRWGGIGDGYLGPAFYMRFKPGHVLYGSRRTYLRKVAVADFEGITANTTYVLESADPKVLLPELLPFIMQTAAFAQHSIRESKGSVNPYVNFSDLAWFEFALPPMEVQQKATRLLTAARSVTDASWDVHDATNKVYQSALFNTFAPDRSAVLDVSPARWKPASWPVRALGELSSSDSPICYGIVQPGASVDGGIPTATSNNLNIGFDTSIHLTSPTIERGYERSRVRPGDVLIVVKGFGTGKIGIVPDFFSGNITRDLARIRLVSPTNTRFFLHLWRSAPYRWYRRATSVGTTRPELSIGKLREMLVPWPDSSIREQTVIQLDQIDRMTILAAKRKQDASRFQQRVVNAVLDPSGEV